MASRNITTRSGKGASITATENDQNLNSLAGTPETQTGTTYTVVYTDQGKLIDLDNASMVCTLDAIATIAAAIDTDGFMVALRNINATAATVQRSSTDTINGDTSISLGQYETVVLNVDAAGTGWAIVARYDPTLRSDTDTNTSDIATNASDISTNTADIATNTTDIATNTSDISTNAAAIAALPSSIVSRNEPTGIHSSGSVTLGIITGIDADAFQIEIGCASFINSGGSGYYFMSLGDGSGYATVGTGASVDIDGVSSASPWSSGVMTLCPINGHTWDGHITLRRRYSTGDIWEVESVFIDQTTDDIHKSAGYIDNSGTAVDRIKLHASYTFNDGYANATQLIAN